MRRKRKQKKLPAKSNQDQGKPADQSSERIVFVDESAIKVQVKTDESNGEQETIVKGFVKDDNEKVIAVIDKNPARCRPSEGSTTGANDEVEDIPEDEDIPEVEDVPEDVSWKSSKETAIRERTLEKEIILDAKRKEKQSRIERNKRLLEQKERKRAREYSRLPMDVLQQVAKRQKSQKSEDLVPQSVDNDTGNHMTFDSSNEDDQEEEGPEVNEEIPEIKVLVLPREVKKPKRIQQSASLFLREQLYGDRIRRISPSKDSDRTRKYKTMAPALKFSKKLW